MNDKEWVLDISFIITGILLVTVVALNPNGNFSCNKRDCLCVEAAGWLVCSSAGVKILPELYLHSWLIVSHWVCAEVSIYINPETCGVGDLAVTQTHTCRGTRNGCMWEQGILLVSFQPFFSHDFAPKRVLCSWTVVGLVSSKIPQVALTSKSRFILNQWTVQHSVNMHSTTPLEFPQKSSWKENSDY